MKEFEANFLLHFNDASAKTDPKSRFKAQAKDLKKHIFATIKPRKRRLRLLAKLNAETAGAK